MCRSNYKRRDDLTKARGNMFQVTWVVPFADTVMPASWPLGLTSVTVLAAEAEDAAVSKCVWPGAFFSGSPLAFKALLPQNAGGLALISDLAQRI